MNDESKIVDFMINRKNINPLKQIIYKNRNDNR